MLIASYQEVVTTDYGSFEFSPEYPRDVIYGHHPEFDLAVFAQETLRVKVGVRYGPVNVELEIHDSPTPYDDTEWEDAAEGDLAYDSESGVSLNGPELFQVIPENEEESLLPSGKHRYRVRIYARGRDIEYDAALFGEPVEDYLIQMWPTTEPEPPRQTKNLSGR